MPACRCSGAPGQYCATCAALLARVEAQPVRLPRPVLTPADLTSEARFLAAVVRAAEAQGYLAYHTYRSTRSAPGWPDLALAKAGHPLLLIECKTNTGRVTPEQQAWLDVVAQTTAPIAEVWRPAQWEHILELLGYR